MMCREDYPYHVKQNLESAHSAQKRLAHLEEFKKVLDEISIKKLSKELYLSE